MNVTAASLPAMGLAPTNGAANKASPLASLLDPSTPEASAAQSKRDAQGSAPGPDVAKKLKALGEQFLAIMLIQDPEQRAKAAAGLYKQYAQTAKDYAGATADGRAAAQAATQANAATQATPDADTASAQASGDDPAAAPAAAEVVQPADADTQAAAQPATADAVAASPVLTPGKRSNFAQDLFMEQIKMFAKATQDVYRAAVEEARRKGGDKSKAHQLDDQMKDARDMLTEAAKAVEGPAATAEGYDPVGASLSTSEAPSSLNVTA